MKKLNEGLDNDQLYVLRATIKEAYPEYMGLINDYASEVGDQDLTTTSDDVIIDDFIEYAKTIIGDASE